MRAPTQSWYYALVALPALLFAALYYCYDSGTTRCPEPPRVAGLWIWGVLLAVSAALIFAFPSALRRARAEGKKEPISLRVGFMFLCICAAFEALMLLVVVPLDY
jgi:drug/metabolite transporter (DMT)-like permease